MNDTLAVALGWGICAIALFSYLGVRAWAEAQRREREAYYRAEAIKKVAEMQGPTPEPVLALLREALKPPPAPPPSPWTMTTGQAREFYRGEMWRRMAELPNNNTDAVIALMREEEKRSARRARAGLKLAGLILLGVGIALYIMLQAVDREEPVYLAGLIPSLVGVAFLAYAFLLAPSD